MLFIKLLSVFQIYRPFLLELSSKNFTFLLLFIILIFIFICLVNCFLNLEEYPNDFKVLIKNTQDNFGNKNSYGTSGEEPVNNSGPEKPKSDNSILQQGSKRSSDDLDDKQEPSKKIKNNSCNCCVNGVCQDTQTCTERARLYDFSNEKNYTRACCNCKIDHYTHSCDTCDCVQCAACDDDGGNDNPGGPSNT